MQFTITVVTLFASLAVAVPAVIEQRQYVACSGLYSTAQCCATDVLGVADLDCANRSSPNFPNFGITLANNILQPPRSSPVPTTSAPLALQSASVLAAVPSPW